MPRGCGSASRPSSCCALSPSATSSAWATRPAMSACTWKTSVSDGVERLLPPRRGGGARRHLHQLGTHPHPALPVRRFSQRILPTSRYCTPSSCAICSGVLLECLYWPALLLAITLSPPQRGQLAPDLVGDAVGEVLVGRVAQVLEREHGEQPGGAGTRGLDAAMGAEPAEQHAEAEHEAEPEREGEREPATRRSGGGAGDRRAAARGLGAARDGPAARFLQRPRELGGGGEPVGRRLRERPRRPPGPRPRARSPAPRADRPRRLQQAAGHHRLRRGRR